MLLWGTVVECKLGWRASHAYPERIYVRSGAQDSGPIDISPLRSEDEQIRAAVRCMALSVRVVVEPTGAVAPAAVLSGKLPLPPGSRVGVVLSGGNVDPDLLVSILSGNDQHSLTG